MRYYFIVNPKAGKGRTGDILQEIRRCCEQYRLEYEIIRSESKRQLLEYIRNVTGRGELIRLYAIGGDGTLNDALNGITDFNNTELGCIPCGTGNDFIKCLPAEKETLLNIEAQLRAEAVPLDMLTVGDVRSINICNIGIDAGAAYYMQKIKNIPFLRRFSYILGLAWSVCRPFGFPMTMRFDDGTVVEDTFSIAVFANGICYGGGFYAAPEAKPNDGKIDVCLMKKISHFTFLKLVGLYKKGLHVKSEKFSEVILYRNAEKVTISSPKEMKICYDGEILLEQSVEVTLLPGHVKFILP